MRKRKKHKKVKKQYHLAIDMAEPEETKNVVILTTPRGSEGLLEILTRQRESLFEWQEQLMARIREDRAPVWESERFMARGFFSLAEHQQNPCPAPCEEQREMRERLNAEIIQACGFKPCAGCGSWIDSPENFPKGYPKERMLCCGCTYAYHWAKGVYIRVIGRNLGLYARNPTFCKSKWDKYGEKIEKAMRIQ